MLARTATESEKGQVSLIYAVVLSKEKQGVSSHMSSESGSTADVYWQVGKKKKNEVMRLLKICS